MRTLPALMVFGLALTGCGASAAAPEPSPSWTASKPIPTVSVNTSPVSARSSTGEVVLTLSQPYDGAHVKLSFTVAGSSVRIVPAVSAEASRAAGRGAVGNSPKTCVRSSRRICTAVDSQSSA